jgi:hypothetical protein
MELWAYLSGPPINPQISPNHCSFLFQLEYRRRDIRSNKTREICFSFVAFQPNSQKIMDVKSGILLLRDT